MSERQFGHQRMLSLIAALSLPMLMGFYLPPLPTWLNQCLALLLWGMAVMACAGSMASGKGLARPMSRIALALAALALAVLLNGLGFGVSLVKPLVACFVLAAAAMLAEMGFRLARQGHERSVTGALAWGLLLLSCVTALACALQVFAPQWCGSVWLPGSLYPGRAVGLVGQSNLSATAMAWGVLAGALLLQRQVLSPAVGFALMLLQVMAIVLTASRMGLVWLGIMAVWACLDRSLSRQVRVQLVLTLPTMAIAWWAANALQAARGSELLLTQRLAEWSSSSSRLDLWRGSWQLLAAHPWVGIGWADFSFAWTLTPLGPRGQHLNNHAHNLLLHLAVELGVPVALGFLGLLLPGLLRVRRAMATAGGEGRAEVRLLVLMLAVVALHAQLEYPLWYLFFLFPTALMLGLCEGMAERPSVSDSARSFGANWGWRLLGGGMVLAALFAGYDYLKVAAIYEPAHQGQSSSLQQRLYDGQQSSLNSSLALRAAVIGMQPSTSTAWAAAIAAHDLLDVRLLIAWADALAVSGDTDRARYVAQRIAEFDTPESAAYLAPCRERSSLAQPYQCAAPSRVYELVELRR